MRILLKIAGAYFLATLPFAWQLHSAGHGVPNALLYGLRGPYDATVQVINGSMGSLVPLGAFIFILFIGLSVAWMTESSRSD